MVADAEGPCQSDGKILVGRLATGLGLTGKPALTSNSYQQTRNLSCHSHIHPCTGPVFGSKLGQTLSHDSEWTSKIHSWYQIKTGSVHKTN